MFHISLHVLCDALFTSTCTTSGCKYSCYMNVCIVLCSYVSLFMSSMTPLSLLPFYEHFFFRILYDTLFTSTCTTTTACKYYFLYECVHLFMFISLFMSSVMPCSPLRVQHQYVSTLVTWMCTVNFYLHVLCDIFFTSTCTTSGCKYSCYVNVYCKSLMYIFLFMSFMTPCSPLPEQQQQIVSTLCCMNVCIFLCSYPSSCPPWHLFNFYLFMNILYPLWYLVHLYLYNIRK